MKRTLLFCSFLIACGGSQTSRTAPHQSRDHKGGSHGAAERMLGLTHGICQSPVNIDTASAGTGNHSVAIHYQAKDERVANLGHTVQVSFGDGGNIEFDGKRYNFRQFHFHTPSEHWVDGTPYPLEMHLVHTLESDDQRYFVFSVLFENGSADPFLDAFLQAIPKSEGQTKSLGDGTVDVNTLFADNPGYFQYRGSLTTPPYTETVQWAILKKHRTASQPQVEAIMNVEGNNARQLQPLYGRPVESD